MKKNKKYAFGIDSLLKNAPQESVGAFMSLIPTIANAISTVENANKVSQYPMTQSSMARTFAMGGTVNQEVPINVEGGETFSTPDGETGEFDGASHSQGGIDTTLPEKSTIYSDRINIGNKSLADRHKARLMREAKFKKLLDSNPNDVINQQTYDKIVVDDTAQDESDKALMKQVNQMQDQINLVDKFMFGDEAGKKSYAYGIDELDPLPILQPNTVNSLGGLFGELPNKPLNEINRMTDGAFGELPLRNMQPLQSETSNLPELNDIVMPTISSSNPTGVNTQPQTGDNLGMMGNYVDMLAPLMSTITNRTGDTPNVNTFKNVDNRTVSKYGEAVMRLRGLMENNMADNRTAVNTTAIANRNNATDLNTLRALDQAAYNSVTDANNKAYNNYEQALTGLDEKIAGTQFQADNQIAQAESQRLENDKRDRDNYFTNINKDALNIGKGLQVQGKIKNDRLRQDDELDIMSSLSTHGLKFERVNGKLVLVSDKTKK
jgi:hypothetical protein